MYRIGIIGSENSHAMAFSKIYNSDAPEDKALNCRVVAIMGEEEEASQKVFDECGLEFIAKSADDLLGRVDAVMVTSRNGALHLNYARPFVEKGLPVFVDKPVANDPAEARKLVMLAKASGAQIMGGSSVKLVPHVLSLQSKQAELAEKGVALGGSVWAPLSINNPYGGFYFYASHLVEMCMTIFGYEPVTVTAIKKQSGVDALLEYEKFTVSLHFMESAYNYGAVLLSREGAYQKEIDISDCYRLEAMEFAEMLSRGTSPICSRKLIRPVYLLNAIEKAYLTGSRQIVEGPSLL